MEAGLLTHNPVMAAQALGKEIDRFAAHRRALQSERLQNGAGPFGL